MEDWLLWRRWLHIAHLVAHTKRHDHAARQRAREQLSSRVGFRRRRRPRSGAHG